MTVGYRDSLIIRCLLDVKIPNINDMRNMNMQIVLWNCFKLKSIFSIVIPKICFEQRKSLTEDKLGSKSK